MRGMFSKLSPTGHKNYGNENYCNVKCGSFISMASLLFTVTASTVVNVTWLGTSHCNEEVKMAVLEWLRVQEPDLCRDRIYKLFPRWGK